MYGPCGFLPCQKPAGIGVAARECRNPVRCYEACFGFVVRILLLGRIEIGSEPRCSGGDRWRGTTVHACGERWAGKLVHLTRISLWAQSHLPPVHCAEAGRRGLESGTRRRLQDLVLHTINTRDCLQEVRVSPAVVRCCRRSSSDFPCWALV